MKAANPHMTWKKIEAAQRALNVITPIHPTKMRRCPHCGRFVTWGLYNWMFHETRDCPILTKPLNWNDYII